MITENMKKITKELFVDFGIINEDDSLDIPEYIKTDVDVEHWRKSVITSHLDSIEKRLCTKFKSGANFN